LIAFSNRIFILFSAALFFIAAACYAYWQEIYFLIAPVIFIIAIFLIQHPEYLFYALILSLPWSVEFNFNRNLATDLPDEPLMLLAGISIMFFMIFRWRQIRVKKWHPLIYLVLLQFLWIVITVITSTDSVLSIKYLLAKSWYLLAFLALPVFLFRNERVLKISVLLLLCSMLVVTSVIVVRHSNVGFSFGKVSDSVRPFFRNHVNYSSLLVFMVPLQLAFIQLFSSKKIKSILLLILVATVAAVYLSYARGAWLALIAGLLAYWLLRKKALVLGFLFFLSIIVVSIFWLKSNDRFVKLSNDYKSTIFHSDFQQHLIATYQLKDLSNAERIYRWVAGIRMVKDRWETGFGPSTFYREYKSYTLPAFKTYVSDNREQSTVHNYFLLLLVEQGIMGCLLFVSLLAALFWYTQRVYFRTRNQFWKIVTASIASILVMQCFVNFLSDMIETDKVGSIFYLCIATLIVADIKTRKERSDLSTNIESIS
jgi:O-antigen ligase